MANNQTQMNTHHRRINDQLPDIVTYTNITVFLKGIRVGVIQRLERREQRDMAPVQELGTENVVQIVPGNTRGGTLTVERFALYNNRLHQLLGTSGINAGDGQNDNRGELFMNLYQQRIPFEIQVNVRTPSGQPYTETYVDCWVSNYSRSSNTGTITLTETCEIQYAFVV